MISIFGIEYIQDLITDEVKSEVLGVVTGLRFVASLGGICAIKLLGADWEADWLGKIPMSGHVWHGMIRETIPGLHCTYNVS